MNRGILDVRLAAVLVVFLVGSVSLIGVYQRAEANRAINATCSSCGSSSSAAQVLNTTILEGAEKNKAIATALSSEDYKNVKKLFPKSVYDPIRDNATAAIVNVEYNGTEYEVSAVFMPFEAEAGLEAGIVFMTIGGHVVSIGAIVNLQSETPIFAAMSMDGKAVEVPLTQGSPCSSCSSCGSGVSPMVDNCGGDMDCEIYGPEYCCVNGWCQYCECWSDYDCQQKYGEGYCCVNRQCQLCPPPPISSCEFCLWICQYAKALGCGSLYAICAYVAGYICMYLYPVWPFCAIVVFLICTGMVVYVCWWLEYTNYYPSCYEICTWAGYCP